MQHWLGFSESAEDTQEPAEDRSDEDSVDKDSSDEDSSDEDRSDEDSSDEDSSDEDSSDEDTQEPAEDSSDGGNGSEEGEYEMPPGAKAGNEILVGSGSTAFKFVVPDWYKECEREW